MRHCKVPNASGWWWETSGDHVWIRFEVSPEGSLRAYIHGVLRTYTPRDEESWYGPWLRAPENG